MYSVQSKGSEVIEFKLVFWASSSHILGAWSNFLLVLLNMGGFRGGPRWSRSLFCGFIKYFSITCSIWIPGILRNLSVQNALDCISENFNLKNFLGGACTRNSLENCTIRSPDIATVYSRPPLSQNPLSTPA